MEITLVEGDYGQTVTTQLRDRTGPLPIAGRPIVFTAGTVEVEATGGPNGFVTFVVPYEITAQAGVSRCRWKVEWNGNVLSVPDAPSRLNVLADTR